MNEKSELLTVGEAARMIRVCVRTVYRMIDEGQLPRLIKIRSRSFLVRSDLVAYLVKQGLPESALP